MTHPLLGVGREFLLFGHDKEEKSNNPADVFTGLSLGFSVVKIPALGRVGGGCRCVVGFQDESKNNGASRKQIVHLELGGFSKSSVAPPTCPK